MRLSEFNEQTDGLVRRYEYGDENVVVADLGVSDEAASVDVVDGTAILVFESGDGEPVQKELKLPDGEVAKALINNGVVTIEVSL
jgi:HSP20 family molecular chaperone IbpA